jgi:hypothetical protein
MKIQDAGIPQISATEFTQTFQESLLENRINRYADRARFRQRRFFRFVSPSVALLAPQIVQNPVVQDFAGPGGEARTELDLIVLRMDGHQSLLDYLFGIGAVSNLMVREETKS